MLFITTFEEARRVNIHLLKLLIATLSTAVVQCLTVIFSLPLTLYLFNN